MSCRPWPRSRALALNIIVVATAICAALFAAFPGDCLAEDADAAVWKLVGTRTFVVDPTPGYHQSASVAYSDKSVTMGITQSSSSGSFEASWTSHFDWTDPPKSIAVGGEGDVALDGSLSIEHQIYSDRASFAGDPSCGIVVMMEVGYYTPSGDASTVVDDPTSLGDTSYGSALFPEYQIIEHAYLRQNATAADAVTFRSLDPASTTFRLSNYDGGVYWSATERIAGGSYSFGGAEREAFGLVIYVRPLQTGYVRAYYYSYTHAVVPAAAGTAQVGPAVPVAESSGSAPKDPTAWISYVIVGMIVVSAGAIALVVKRVIIDDANRAVPVIPSIPPADSPIPAAPVAPAVSPAAPRGTEQARTPAAPSRTAARPVPDGIPATRGARDAHARRTAAGADTPTTVMRPVAPAAATTVMPAVSATDAAATRGAAQGQGATPAAPNPAADADAPAIPERRRGRADRHTDRRAHDRQDGPEPAANPAPAQAPGRTPEPAPAPEPEAEPDAPAKTAATAPADPSDQPQAPAAPAPKPESVPARKHARKKRAHAKRTGFWSRLAHRSGKPSKTDGGLAGQPGDAAHGSDGDPRAGADLHTYCMVMKKDFGNTLGLDDGPRTLGVRIVEVEPDGMRFDRQDLTSQIIVIGDDNVRVTQLGIDGDSLNVAIQPVDRGPGQDAPTACVLSFVYAEPSATHRANVRFAVAGDIGLDFPREALTFVAGEGQTLRMPFHVTGTLLEPTFRLAIASPGAENFCGVRTVAVEDSPGSWYVELTECGKAGMQPAGYMEALTCEIEAVVHGRKGEHAVRGSFDFFRFHEGVRFNVEHLRCYCVAADDPDEPHLPGDAEDPPVPARTRASVALYTWDRTTGRLLNPLPAASDVKFTFRDVPGSDAIRNVRGIDLLRPCESLGLAWFATGIEDGGDSLGFDILPTRGFLIPPNQSQAEVTVQVAWEGRVFSAVERVNVCSQPYRSDYAENYPAYDAEDAEKTGNLRFIQRGILDSPELSALMPLYHKVESMIDARTEEFGYYEPDYLRVGEIFTRYADGSIGSGKANELVFLGQDISRADALGMSVLDPRQSWSLLGTHVSCGFCALPPDVCESITPYINALPEVPADTGHSGALLEPFRVGAPHMDADEGDGGTGTGGDGNPPSEAMAADAAAAASAGAGVTADARAAALECAAALSDRATRSRDAFAKTLKRSYSTGRYGKLVANSAADVINQLEKSRAEAAELAQKCMKLLERSDDELRRDLGFTLGRKAGRDLFLDEVESVKRWEDLSPNGRRKAVLPVQANKHAMHQLLTSQHTLANTVREDHAQVVGEISQEAVDQVRVTLAHEFGVPLSDVRIASPTATDRGTSVAGGTSFEVRAGTIFLKVSESIARLHFDQARYRVSHKVSSIDDAMADAVARAAELYIAPISGDAGHDVYDEAILVAQKGLAAAAFGDVRHLSSLSRYDVRRWLDLSRKALQDAQAQKTAGNMEAAVRLADAAQRFHEEGCGQLTRQFDRILVRKLHALAAKGIKADVATLATRIDLLSELGLDQHGGAGLTMAEATLCLKEVCGTTLSQIVNDFDATSRRLDEMLERLQQ